MPPFLRLALIALAAVSLAACNSVKSPEAPPPPVAAPAPRGKPPVSGVLSGALGQKLEDADRQTAFDAQLAALDSGQRRTWKGGRGMFGFVEAGPETARAEGTCRTYAHKIYFAGRPQGGEGLACKAPDGGWKIAS